MMKTKFTLLLVLLFVCLMSAAQNLSTGIDNAGNSLAIGDLDPNWHTVSSPNLPSIEARVCGYYPGYWQPAPIAGSNAMWINFSGDFTNNIPGTYTFERKFTIAPNTPSFVCNFRAAWDDIALSFDLVSPTGVVTPLPYTSTSWYHLTQLIQHEVVNPDAGAWKIRAQINFFDSAAAFLLSGDIRICGTLLPQNLQTDLIAFYPFNSGSLLDYSPNHYDLSNSSGVPQTVGDRNGMPNCAYEFFGGQNDFLTAPMPTGIIPDANTPFSVSLWYKPKSSNVSGYELLFGRGSTINCPDGMGEFSVGLFDCRAPSFMTNQYSCWDGTMPGTWCGDVAANYLVQGWQHLAVIYDPLQPLGSQLLMYRDGQLSTILNGPCGNPYADAGDIMIGLGFLGLIDDIFFYKRVLSQVEVYELMAMGSSCCQFLIIGNDAPLSPTQLHAQPNPNNGRFKFTTPAAVGEVEAVVLDALGRVVWASSFLADGRGVEVEAVCEDQPAGIYFLRVKSAEGVAVQRVVIQ